MSVSGGRTPIEDYLDELLCRTHADPRTTRRLLDEAGDHLAAAAAELEAAGWSRVEAEQEAVHRFGAVSALARASWRRCFGILVMETLRAAVLLLGCASVAVGVSGGVVALMNALFGDRFVGGTTVFGTDGSTVAEAAQDAVVLRVLAGILGLLVLGAYAVLRRHTAPARVLPPGLVDALGAAAFAAATIGLADACVAQSVAGTAGSGVGFFLSGAVASFAGAIVFGARATRALLPSRMDSTRREHRM